MTNAFGEALSSAQKSKTMHKMIAQYEDALGSEIGIHDKTRQQIDEDLSKIKKLASEASGGGISAADQRLITRLEDTLRTHKYID